MKSYLPPAYLSPVAGDRIRSQTVRGVSKTRQPKWSTLRGGCVPGLDHAEGTRYVGGERVLTASMHVALSTGALLQMPIESGYCASKSLGYPY
jgi:hypothetical protein